MPPLETRTDSPGETPEEPQDPRLPESPRCLSPFQGNLFFPALPRLSSRGSTHTTVARGTALWESLVGKPRGKALWESHRYLDPREGKSDPVATAREESPRACPHSRRGLTPLGRLQKNPKIHVCRGPAPVDPGNSKGVRRWRGKTCLFINVRLD